jgi:hypothetical protein
MFKLVLIIALCACFYSVHAQLTTTDLGAIASAVAVQNASAAASGLTLVQLQAATALTAALQLNQKASLDIATDIQVQAYVAVIASDNVTAPSSVLDWYCASIDSKLVEIQANAAVNAALKASIAVHVSASATLTGLLTGDLVANLATLLLNPAALSIATQAKIDIATSVSVDASLSASLTLYQGLKVACKAEIAAFVAADAIGATVLKTIVDVYSKVSDATFLDALNTTATVSANIQSVTTVIAPVQDNTNQVVNFGLTAIVETDPINPTLPAAQAAALAHLLATIAGKCGCIVQQTGSPVVTAITAVSASLSITVNLKVDQGISNVLVQQYATLATSPTIVATVASTVQASLGALSLPGAYATLNPQVSGAVTLLSQANSAALSSVASIQVTLQAKLAIAATAIATVKLVVNDSTHLITDNIKNIVPGILAGLDAAAVAILKDALYVDLRLQAYTLLKTRLMLSVILGLLSPTSPYNLTNANITALQGQLEVEFAAKEFQLEVEQSLDADAHTQVSTVAVKINATHDLIVANAALIASGSYAAFATIKAQLAVSVLPNFTLHVVNAMLALHNDVLDGADVENVVVGQVSITFNVVLYVKVGVTLSASDQESFRAHVAAIIATIVQCPNSIPGPVQSAKRSLMQSGTNLTVPMTVSGANPPATSGVSSTGGVTPSTTSSGTVTPATTSGTVTPATTSGTVTPATTSGTVTPATTSVINSPTSSASTYVFGLSSLLVVLIASLVQF